MADSTSPAGGSQIPTAPLKKGRSSLRRWEYLLNYVLLGAAALIILLEIIDSGLWLWLGLALLFMSVAISNLASMHARELSESRDKTPPALER
jgi:hypothetical protein